MALYKEILTIGAGTGQANLLRGLRICLSHVHLTAIVGVTDTGGHSGLLRQQFKMPAVGDGRQVLVALANDRQLADLFDHRFQSEDQTINGASAGNFFLAALCQQYGDIAQAFAQAAKLLGCVGEILPPTIQAIDVGAVFTDGQRAVGEWEIIDKGVGRRIQRVFLQPAADAYPPAIEAISNADWIIIGPGALLTGIVPTLLVSGIKEALMQAKAKLIYVSNLMTQPGQTDGFSLKDHLTILESYLGRLPEVVVFNNGKIAPATLKHYAEIQSFPVTDGSDLRSGQSSGRIISCDLVSDRNGHPLAERIGSFRKWTHLLVHHPEKSGAAIKRIIQPRGD